MNRNELIVETMIACQAYKAEVMNEFIEYFLLAITLNIVRIEVRYFDEFGDNCRAINFPNDENLIERMLKEL